MSEVTRILSRIEQGDPSVADQLLPLVYDELRTLAAQRLRHEKPGQTIQATVLVHEAYLRLVDARVAQSWRSRGHFFAAAAEAMRRILIENARRKARVKHGGKLKRIDVDRVDLATHAEPAQLLALDDAIERLAREDDIAAKLVQVRYFAGLSIEQAAATLDISTSTAYRHWTYARAWLHARLASAEG